MATTDRREREKQELRTKILDAARELFAAEGYEAVTMRKIAERIEYSPTAIYGHFKDKNALIRELCENDFLTFAQKFAEFLSIEDPLERLRLAGDAYVDFAIDNPQQYRLMLMTERPPIGDEEPPNVNDPAANAYAFLKATVSDAIAKGLFRPDVTDVDLTAPTNWAALHGLVALQITAYCPQDKWMGWPPLAERRAFLKEVLLRGLLREPKPT